ncbi:hypothetical protein E4T56_gene19957, partial [Termitomyces sp. T112]
IPFLVPTRMGPLYSYLNCVSPYNIRTPERQRHDLVRNREIHHRKSSSARSRIPCHYDMLLDSNRAPRHMEHTILKATKMTFSSSISGMAPPGQFTLFLALDPYVADGILWTAFKKPLPNVVVRDAMSS